MNANTNSRLNKDHRTPTLTVAPVTRAIRTALAISATLLALGGSGAAFAQTCVATSSTVETCEGIFTGTVPGTFFTPVADLTLVLGDSANSVPTSVTPAAGLMGIDAEWGGNVGVTSYADITTTGATGIFAYGSTSATVNNSGSITTDVTAPGAKAMDISAYGDVTVVNSGAVKAYSTGSNDVTAVNASSLFGNADVYNKFGGTITASAQDGNAIAVDESAYSAPQFRNEGAIIASSVNGIAIGVLEQSSTSESIWENFGSVTVTSTNGQAVGALVSGASAYAENLGYTAYFGPLSGHITVTSGADAAVGLEAYGESYALARSTGSITVTSDGGTATGIIADVYKGAARIINTGSISATALSYSPAVGVEAYSAFSGAASVNNSGSIAATALSGNATGIIAQAHYGQVSVVNSGDVSATAGAGTSYYQHNKAIGIVASSGAGYSPGITHVTNSGSIFADGPSLGEGIDGSARYGDLTITNTASGTITATGQNEAIGIGTGQTSHNSFGRYIDGYTSQAIIDNAGSITASADATACAACTQIEATGIQVFLNLGNDVTVTNSGDIGVSVLGGSTANYSEALGIDAVTDFGDITVNNSGSIAVAAKIHGPGQYTETNYNVGILTNTASGATSIVNSGDIDVNVDASVSFRMYGIWASSSGAEGISVVNSASINLTTPGTVYVSSGIKVNSGDQHGYGVTTVINSGDVDVSANAGTAMYGIEAYAFGSGDFTVNNSGSITTRNNTFTFHGYGGTSFVTGGISTGILAKFGSIGGTATITNSGDINTTGGSIVSGIYARYDQRSNYLRTGDLTLDNSGSISVTTDNFTNPAASYLKATGIGTRNGSGTTTLTNSGSITATVFGDPVAFTYSYGGVVSTIVNAGVQGIAVMDVSDFDIAPHTVIPGNGAISITNTGSITASITSNGHAYAGNDDAMGIAVQHGYGTVDVANSGSITAAAQNDAATVAGTSPITASGIRIKNWIDFGSETGRVYSQGSETLTNGNTGSITASATSNYADVSASAKGIDAVLGIDSTSIVYAANGITIDNAGLVSANATVGGANTLGAATATGISAFSWSNGFAHITNNGTLNAAATSPGVATATGISATANDITIALGTKSLIVATANGANSVATGLYASGATVSASNLGTLKAIATGSNSTATGAQLISPAALTFTNTGAIHANAAHAVTVDLTSATSATMINTGLIVARPTVLGTNGIAVQTSAPNAVIQNYGTITGKLRNGAGNFTFTNFAGGIWNAAGISNFGAGDDFLRNVGTIDLDGSTIDLGAPDTLGNRFTNATGGTITVTGNNSINMGTANTSANVFVNNGTLNFQNGAVGDTLAIAGNFSGNGTIDMDVNGLTGTSDKLAIEGNVLAGSVNTVNVDLLTDPTAASTLVPLITVSGTSVAGSFVLGKVVQNKSFLDVLVSKLGVYSLSLTAPTSAASPSGFAQATFDALRPAVGFEESVAGLSDLGTLAASTAPGVQSLMNSQVGTLEDRMGAVSQTIKGGFSVWTRAFADSGTVDPGHSAGNFGQNGNFGFDQSNSGAELGLDFALSDEFKAGALFAKSQANQSLDGNMADSSRITGDTSGLYGTWISTSGFYVDGSYRWMTFNDRLHAPTGYASIHGNADAFNLEAGKTWTLQNGLQIAPQFQYTLTKVDNINAQAGSLAGFQSNGDDASRARLGVMFSKEYTPASSHAMWMPYASLSAVQELDGKNSYSVNDTFFGETNTKGTSVLAETGVNVQLGQLAVFGGLNWQDGGAMKSFFGGQVGLRYTW